MAKPGFSIRLLVLAALATGLAATAQAGPKTISFSDHSWIVRESGKGGPGPNHWRSQNVWLDANGYLHLKITHRNGVWYCAELQTTDNMGFGTYQFWLDTPVNALDPQVVLGLFDYTVPGVGPDGTNEIDIEFSRWGNPKWPNGNYTVYPAKTGKPDTTHAFELTDASAESTHRFIRSSASVGFQSLAGHQNNGAGLYESWTFAPKNPQALVPQAPLPVHINLWLAKGKPPIDGQEVEVVIRSFTFTPQ
jgi:hypothetical protein